MMEALRERVVGLLATAPQANALDLWTVAQTIVGEADTQPDEGQEAIAWVIVNRQRYHVRWKGQTLRAICLAPKQFSTWNSAANVARLQAMTLSTPTMATALFHALAVLSGKVTSPCGYATHYYNPRLAKPPWAYDAHGQLIDPVAVLGDHVFLENIP